MSEDGSEGSTSRPKRKIKKVMVLPSSSSSSDSDESIGNARIRKRRLRVVSEDSDSGSSGSSIVRPGTRRKRTLKLRDSDGESDTSGWGTDNSGASKAASSTPKPISGFQSDSSEGNSDKCSICLMRFKDQLVGTPESCEHIFCLDCITEWSQNVNTCPVDRITFDFIVVKTCVGGQVLRKDAVKVIERRPSVDSLVVEDPTACEICGSSLNEDTMLLCDGCDLGFHMQCLTPPLTQIPTDQWFCASCGESRDFDDIENLIYLSEVDDLLTDLADIDIPLNPRSSLFRQSRYVRRSSRNIVSDEPSTSSGHRGNNTYDSDLPTTSRSRNYNVRNTISRRTNNSGGVTRRRKYKRRKTKTIVVEYEVRENGKFPVTKRVTRKVKKRKSRKRQPRTAARRTHVRASVRAKLASMKMNQKMELSRVSGANEAVQNLSIRQHKAGIPALSLFGNPHQLEYFSDEEYDMSEGATATVALRPTSSMLSAYRQARRKAITIYSPPQAAPAPDILSSILEDQTLLHSKNSVVSLSVGGRLDIKLKIREPRNILQKATDENKDKRNEDKGKIDLSKVEAGSGRQAPSYPGQSRGGSGAGGGGGWGGGYRGNYHREHGAHSFRGAAYDAPGAGYQNRQGNFYPNNNARRDESDAYSNFPRRPHQYLQNEEIPYDRSRRQYQPDPNRAPNNLQRLNEQGRSSGPPWQPYASGGSGQYSRPHDPPPMQTRHSFGGFEIPLDMRMSQAPPHSTGGDITRHSYVDSSLTKPQSFRPLPEPPVFKFDKGPEIEKSEDEKSDPGLVIDTDKYDPTEPTHDDDDSGDETKIAFSTEEEPILQNATADIDTSTLNVPPNVLDTAVRQVLEEHRDLIVPSIAPSHDDRSDDESDGDCPNFSIYSATSVHIANDTSGITVMSVPAMPENDLEDLVQEDDDVHSPERPASIQPQVDLPNEVIKLNMSPEMRSNNIQTPSKSASDIKPTENQYNQKLSKRCPITPTPRNPIKIKLNTPSLIKRHVSLYDEEDISNDGDIVDKVETFSSVPELKSGIENKTEDNGLYEHEHNELEEDELKSDSISMQREDNNEDKITEGEDKALWPTDEDETPIREDSGQLPLDNVLNDTQDNVRVEEQQPDSPSGKSEKSGNDLDSDEENELDLKSQTSKNDISELNQAEVLEKMTESISETEDERSYTPCLDENKSKDTSLETEKEKGIEGLDTEMISEEEGNDIFSEEETPASERVSPSPRAPSVTTATSPVPIAPSPIAAPEREEGEILDASKRKEKKTDDRDETKKKKKKESKKDSKSKGKKQKGEIAFKKPNKSGKERNYRERDKEKESKGKKRDRRESSGDGDRKRRKEKRKDLERYDVRNVVIVKRRKMKDAFGRDVSPPRSRSRSPSMPRIGRSPSPSRDRQTPSLARHRSPTPLRRRSPSPMRRRSLSPLRRRSLSPLRRRSPSPLRRRSPSAMRRRAPSSSPPSREHTPRRSPSPHPGTPRRRDPPRKRRRPSPRRPSPRRPRSSSRILKRRRSADVSPRPKLGKRKRRSRARSERRESPRRKSPRRRRVLAAASPPPAPAWSPPSIDSRLLSPRTPPPDPSPPSAPPADIQAERRARRERRKRRDVERARHRRARDAPGPSKEVFTSGDNILVSVSFKDQDRAEDGSDGEERRRRREARRERRRKRRRTGAAETEAPKPVAIIDLERSPFRELTPSPKNVIVLSDSDHGETVGAVGASTAGVETAGPKTPPEPVVPLAPVKFTIAAKPAPGPRGVNPLREEEAVCETEGATAQPGAGGGAAVAEGGGPNTPPSPPSSPDAYDPFEPTRSASASPAPALSPERPSITLETAQKTNLSADDVIDRRPLSPMEKVMALLASTRDVSPEPPPAAPGPSPALGPAPGPPASLVTTAAPGAGAAPGTAAPSAPPVRIVLPSPTRAAPPKLFLAKPSPIKSNPIKPMQQVTKISKLPLPAGAGVMLGTESPYSPGSSDFGELFSPPGGGAQASSKRDVFDSLFPSNNRRKDKSSVAKVPVKFNRKKGGRTQVGVKIDEDNLKILDDLPSSAVEMQVKSKFLKKLNRQERVVEEVKLVLKPHYNKKRVSKEEYKHVLRQCVPKICHNKTGEINPTKIQALVEAYVKKIRKKRKLGLV